MTDFEKRAGFFSLLLKINYSYYLNNAMVTRWVRVAGHSYLARHQSLLYNNSTICCRCQTGEETSWHLIWEYLVVIGWEDIPQENWAVIPIRRIIFPFQYLGVEDYKQIKLLWLQFSLH